MSIVRLALIICALLAMNVAAQAPPAKPAIVLPPKMVSGEIATIAVLDASGALQSGVTVEFSGGARITTDATGRARVTAPSQQGIMTAQIAGMPASRATTMVIAASESGEIAVRDYPQVVSLQDRFNLSGRGFNGQADANRVTLGGQPAIVLAASPVALVIVAGPGAAPGSAEVTVTSGERSSAPVRLTLIALEIQAADAQVAPKAKSALTIRARGSELPLEIAVQNLSPDVIEFTRGEPLRVTTRGGSENNATVEIRGRREGDYAVSARLVPSAVGLPDLSAARAELLAARKLAAGAWQRRVDRVLRHLEEHPQHFLDAQHELEKMLAELPPAELATRLQAAWLALLKR